ncbi:MAG TPA: hypothetical protein PLU71_04210 [Candidatus Dependentiae bacterium]|nr:hypothetical protein [Candidatus Dependentiae bacterium]HRQ63036.1 hypothetical protein [Candidatus Dependentiae bacterium]
MNIKNIFFILFLVAVQLHAMELQQEFAYPIEEYRQELAIFVSNLFLRDAAEKQNIIKTVQMIQEFDIPISLCGNIDFLQQHSKSKFILTFNECDPEFGIDYEHTIDVGNSFYDTKCNNFLFRYHSNLELLVKRYLEIQGVANYFIKQQVAKQIEQEAHKIMLDLLQK